jgi:glycosyltransferase involved in cell wall biosynthesis
MIVCVGSLDRRKNQLALIHAAEVLWREGRSFALRLLGSGGLPPAELLAGIAELRQQGRAISTESGVSDAMLAEAYQSARFSVFPTLHEGFGLPVVESLSHGTPVVASAVGSILECTKDGGALLFDPRQDDTLVAAMRQLLDDDVLLARLAAEALARPRRTWDDYAASLWDAVAGASPS